MIHVLLTSELPWKHNDAITFFTCLCISRYEEFNHLRELVPLLVAAVRGKV